MYNKVILVGNLTRDPELRFISTGTQVASFGIATNRKFGESQETFFGDVTAWGKLAETCDKYLKKGSKILLEGRLKTENWEHDGRKQSKTRIIAEQIRFLDSKKAVSTDGETGGYSETPSEEETELEPF